MARLAFHQVEAMCDFVAWEFTPSLAGISRWWIKTGCTLSMQKHVISVECNISISTHWETNSGNKCSTHIEKHWFQQQVFCTQWLKTDSHSKRSTHIDKKKLILGASVLHILRENWHCPETDMGVFYTHWQKTSSGIKCSIHTDYKKGYSVWN